MSVDNCRDSRTRDTNAPGQDDNARPSANAAHVIKYVLCFLCLHNAVSLHIA